MTPAFALRPPAHVEVIVAPAGPRGAAGRLPQRAGVVDERPEEDGARDGAEEPHHDPLQAQGEGPMAVRHAPAGDEEGLSRSVARVRESHGLFW